MKKNSTKNPYKLVLIADLLSKILQFALFLGCCHLFWYAVYKCGIL